MAEDSTEVEKTMAANFVDSTAGIWREYKTRIPGDSLQQAMDDFKKKKGVELDPVQVVLAAQEKNQALALRLYDPVIEVMEENYDNMESETAREIYEKLIELVKEKREALRASFSQLLHQN